MAGFARRQFLVAAAAALAPAGALAQAGRTFRVVNVNTASAERKSGLEAFVAAMRELGYIQGRNLQFEEMSAER